MTDEEERKSPPPNIIGTIVGKQFRVVHKLGEGGCGSVFKVEDMEDKCAPYAMKVEFASTNAGNVLKMEHRILTQLVDKRHVAKCVASGKNSKFSYMVMTLLGDSLDSLVRKHGPFFNVSTQIGYIHRDVKPANVALGYKGTSDERIFMVLDFGLARQYVTCGAVVDEKDKNNKNAGKDAKEKSWKMRRPREKALFRGTSRYCSVGMHDRYEQGRVDDLWALIYIMAELRCRLTWHDVDDKVEIGEMKRNIPDELLLAKSPMQMLEFVKIVRNTSFYDRPDYERLFKLLDDVMKTASYSWSDLYHWEPDKKDEKKKREGGKPKKLGLNILTPSIKSLKNRKAKNKPHVASSPGGQTPKGSNSVETAEAPYFTIADFQSNPMGF